MSKSTENWNSDTKVSWRQQNADIHSALLNVRYLMTADIYDTHDSSAECKATHMYLSHWVLGTPSKGEPTVTPTSQGRKLELGKVQELAQV